MSKNPQGRVLYCHIARGKSPAPTDAKRALRARQAPGDGLLSALLAGSVPSAGGKSPLPCRHRRVRRG
jgi:hypothetical protein